MMSREDTYFHNDNGMINTRHSYDYLPLLDMGRRTFESTLYLDLQL